MPWTARWSWSVATTTRSAASLPDGVEIFDAHLHLGTDIDGMIGDYDQLEQLMAEYGIARAFMFCLDEPDRHPAFSAANDRTLAFAERSQRAARPVRPARPERDADRGGAALPRRRRARHQAAPARPEVRLGRRAARAGVRARGRAARADPDPRRARAAADRGRPRVARRALPGCEADHRPRRDRRHGAPRTRDGRPQGRRLRHVDLEPDRPARLPSAGPARAGRLRVRLPVRAVHLVALHRDPHRAARRLRRASSCGCMLGGTAAALADGTELPEPTAPLGAGDLRAADAARAHPPVPVDGDAAHLDEPARHARRARARDQRVRRARRARGGGRPHPRAARDGARPVGDVDATSFPAATAPMPGGSPSGSSTSPTSRR